MLFKGRILRWPTLESKNDGKKNGNHHCAAEQEINRSSESKVTQHRRRVTPGYTFNRGPGLVLFCWFEFPLPSI